MAEIVEEVEYEGLEGQTCESHLAWSRYRNPISNNFFLFPSSGRQHVGWSSSGYIRTYSHVPYRLDQGMYALLEELPGIQDGCDVQTRMQVYTTQPQAIYSGVTNAFSTISAQEGARRLWRGVGSVILGAGPAHAVYFGMASQSMHGSVS